MRRNASTALSEPIAASSDEVFSVGGFSSFGADTQNTTMVVSTRKRNTHNRIAVSTPWYFVRYEKTPDPALE